MFAILIMILSTLCKVDMLSMALATLFALIMDLLVLIVIVTSHICTGPC